MGAPVTLVLLFTTYPVATETFLQREVEALNEAGARLELWSLWKGEAAWGGLPVRRPSVAQCLLLFWWLPYWAVRRPRAIGRIIACLFRRWPPNWMNFWENLLGIGLGLRHAASFERRRDDFVLHAVWASLPAAFAWTVSGLTGCSFTFAGHAYDLFEDGGDWLLPEKCQRATWIRTSTDAAAARLCDAGATPERVEVIRRGLLDLPPPRAAPSPDASRAVLILSVGRLVPKMGYSLQMEVYAQLVRMKFLFKAEIIGAGVEEADLRDRIEQLGLAEHVSLLGGLPFSQVEMALARADVALFTGVVAPNGDRAGFPNFVGEAMVAGVPVVATPVGAVPEAVVDAETGLLAETATALAEAVAEVVRDPAAARLRADRARSWVEHHFDARANMRLFRTRLEECRDV